MTPRPDTLTLSIENRIESLSAGIDEAQAFLADRAVDPGDSAQVMIMLDELGSNIIKSAWPGGGEHRFAMELQLDETRTMTLRVADDGVAFDPTDVTAPDLDACLEDRVVGGLGLFMVSEMSDTMEYSRVDGLNRLVLTKRLQPEASP